MDEEYEKDCYETDYEKYYDEDEDYENDDGREETDERVEIEFTAKDIYDVLESVAYFNYVSRDRYNENGECCCCGITRQRGSVLCEPCVFFWERMEEINCSARDRLYDRIVEWMRQKQDYSFRRFLSVCSKDIGVFVKDDRKTEAVSQLVRCLKEIERMKLVESLYIDDLIQSIAQRWNIVEIS
jgi:hypothetical protein